MANYEMKPNYGSLLQGKKTMDSSPDYYGEILIDLSTIPPAQNGILKVNLGAWIKQTQYGHLLSLKISTYQTDRTKINMNKRSSSPGDKLIKGAPREVDSDEIPF
jgi:phage baseplate assembly protein W